MSVPSCVVLNSVVGHNSHAKRDAQRADSAERGGVARGDARGHHKESPGDPAEDDEESRRELKEAFTRLMGLAEEDVFRQVIGFM